MDNPRNAAQKIRPILQAMERSIDSARRRRTNEPEPLPGSGGMAMNTPAAIPSAAAPVNRGMNTMTGHSQSQRQTALDQTRIGGGSSAGASPAQPSNPAGIIRPGDVHQHVAQTNNPNTPLQPNQPPRLKAKPKPASPFLNELDPPAYRQQAS
jgi:hypothetical protein